MFQRYKSGTDLVTIPYSSSRVLIAAHGPSLQLTTTVLTFPTTSLSFPAAMKARQQGVFGFVVGKDIDPGPQSKQNSRRDQQNCCQRPEEVEDHGSLHCRMTRGLPDHAEPDAVITLPTER